MNRLILLISVIHLIGHFVYAGNEGGGGGNVKPPVLMTPDDFDVYFSHPYRDGDATDLKKSLKYMFQGIEAVTYRLAPEIREKLFQRYPGKMSIYEAIESASLINKKSEACVDPVTGEPADGSAILSTRTVCISTYRLSKKIYTDHSFNPFINLAMHEVSHLVGLNEEEAKLAGVVYLKEDGWNPNYWNVNDLLENIAGSAFRLQIDIEERLGSKELCHSLLNLSDDVSKFSATFNRMLEQYSFFDIENAQKVQRLIWNNQDFIERAEYCVNQAAHVKILKALAKKYIDLKIRPN